MLGSNDFCGHYEWTFHFVRRRFGQAVVRDLWAQAIGGESQDHYKKAALHAGLRGLYETWIRTGKEEQCNWNFTLDEEKNVLRWDMYQCPSKGFLLNRDLNADEDYCDHCMGWIIPMLDKAGVEVVSHEHNHCGQCWAEMRLKDKPSEPLDLACDIRKDARWNRGYLDRWRHNVKLPVLAEASSSSDSCDVITEWFAHSDDLVVLGRGPSAAEPWARELSSTGSVLVTDPTYVTRDVFAGDPIAVLIGDQSQVLREVAQRFFNTEPKARPLLMHMYVPGSPPLDFASAGLPRPVPILPLLIRSDLYVHQPKHPYPTTGVFLALLAIALRKSVSIAGIDLYQHPSGKAYVTSGPDSMATFSWPERHSFECDLQNLQRAVAQARKPVRMSDDLRRILTDPSLWAAASKGVAHAD